MSRPWILGLLWVLLTPALLWAFGALWFDFPMVPRAAAVAFAVGCALAIGLAPGGNAKAAWCGGLFLGVAVWWATLQPSHDRDWQTPVAKLPTAALENGLVTIENLRDFEYLPDGGYEPRWVRREFFLDDIEGMDLAINYWGSPWIAHPIIIFRVRGQEPIAFSLEIRPEEGEEYSALGGFYRMFELIVLAGTERDILRVRTNHRTGEDVYLYNTIATPERARIRFLEYLEMLNRQEREPRWYHAIFANCTTAIRAATPREERLPWDWRLLINGKGDRLLYDLGLLKTDGLEFEELRAQAHINEAARAADQAPDFSDQIRRNRAGF